MSVVKKDFGGWCILRTRGRSTLRLAETLADDGYEVWTPVETRKIQIPRANVKRSVRLAIMPSYVFAKAHHLFDLIMLADQPVKGRVGWEKGYRRDKDGNELEPHADFDVMRCPSGIPMVTDAQLTALKDLEAKLTPKEKRKAERTFAPGVSVKVMGGGSFAGMSGKVERSDYCHTVVCFNDRYLVKIDTCILDLPEGEERPDEAKAA